MILYDAASACLNTSGIAGRFSRVLISCSPGPPGPAVGSGHTLPLDRPSERVSAAIREEQLVHPAVLVDGAHRPQFLRLAIEAAAELSLELAHQVVVLLRTECRAHRSPCV